MKQSFSLDFPGVQAALTSEAYLLTSAAPLLTLSSAVVGGGFQRTRTIINRHVAKHYNHPDPASDLRAFVRANSLPEPFVGLLTGVWIHQVQHVTLAQDDLLVACILTAGVSNAVSAGCTLPVPFVPGTINTILLIAASLPESALVNAVITATEAKSAVLAEAGIRTPDGHIATGTSTDAMVIACTDRGPLLPYAGPGTSIGYLIGASVRQTLQQALRVAQSDV